MECCDTKHSCTNNQYVLINLHGTNIQYLLKIQRKKVVSVKIVTV